MDNLIKDLCKNDIIYFINNYCYFKTNNGYKLGLYLYQEKILKQIINNQNNIGLLTRQMGMTYMSAFIILNELCFGSKTICLMAPRLMDSERILEVVKTSLSFLPDFLKPDLIKNTKREIITANNCRVLIIKDKLFGITPIDYLIIDQACFLKDYPYNIINNSLINNHTKHIYYMSYDYRQKDNSLYKLYLDSTKGLNNFKPFSLRWWECRDNDGLLNNNIKNYVKNSKLETLF
jgi:hypothetical protein